MKDDAIIAWPILDLDNRVVYISGNITNRQLAELIANAGPDWIVSSGQPAITAAAALTPDSSQANEGQPSSESDNLSDNVSSERLCIAPSVSVKADGREWCEIDAIPVREVANLPDSPTIPGLLDE